MYLMIAADFALVPLALIHHPRPTSVAAGLIPALHDAGASSTVLLLVALIGTTIVPWQLFFQQSTVADKRITSRWLSYERADTAIGAALFAACAGAVLILSATALAHSPLRGDFTDVGAVARAVGVQLGSAAGAIFAIALLNASLLCAAAVSLLGSFAVAEVLGVTHSLHRSYHEAKAFHAGFAATVAVAAGLVLLPGLPVGAITTFVQALAGILLPSTLVLLLILSQTTSSCSEC
jgi:Mn2+/Fe2+ NRAMP family transporter